MIIDRLIDRIQELQAPIVVGLDPRLDQIPAFLLDKAVAQHGNTPQSAATAFYAFNVGIIDNICDVVPAVKPQIAMYEQLGTAGIQCYIDTIRYAREKGLIVIGDIKRGDIASTAEAYADGHIGRVDVQGEQHEIYGTDFVTLNPYMGYDAISPYLAACHNYQRGMFVLVKTSNPHSGQLQDLITQEGRPVYAHTGDLVSQWGKDFVGRHGYSSIGAVVGATYPEQGEQLRKAMPHTFFLVPGYGAQGATAKDLRGMFDTSGLGAIVNSSRGITGAFAMEKYSKTYSDKEFGPAARAAVLDMKTDLGMFL